MTLGLPGHLVDATMARALARAANWIGLWSIAGAFVSVASLSATYPDQMLWPSILALVPMALLLVITARLPSLITTIAYLVIGSVSTYVYAVTILSAPGIYSTTDMFVIALPVIALVMVGGTGGHPGWGILWASLGLLLGQLAVFAASLSSTVQYRLDWFAPGAWLLITVVLVSSIVGRNRARGAQPMIHQASSRDSAVMMRRDFETRAVALLHDTALSELTAIASAEAGPVDPRMSGRITRDLEQLIGQDWLLRSIEEQADAMAESARSPLADVFDELAEQGLAIDVSGEQTAVGRLDTARMEALRGAMRQCLVNVLRHSGVTEAEVSITSGSKDVTVMVTDAGRGFDPDASLVDRLGLRQSVVGRVTAVGGQARIWSQSGAGTTILLTVPLHDDADRDALAAGTDDRPEVNR